MTIDSFYNETYNFKLSFVSYSYSNKKEWDKVFEMMKKLNVDKSKIIESLSNIDGLFVGGNDYLILVDEEAFKLKTKKGIAKLIKVIQHECGHLRGEVLRDINEEVETTDSESYLRISDWAFDKCLSTGFVNQFFKVKKSSSSESETIECRSEEGQIIGLIDSIIFISRLLKEKDIKSKGINEALLDLRSDNAVKDLMNSNK